jgi:gamma-glutamylcyclotransferase
MKSVALLQGYRLEFGYFAKRWRGAAANIYPDKDSHVYGVLWELHQDDQLTLDKQEGVMDSIYKRLSLTVETTDGQQVPCVAYQIVEETRADAIKIYGDNLKPSKVYMNVIIRGARENKLPEDYITFLQNIPHNGYDGEVDVNISLKV